MSRNNKDREGALSSVTYKLFCAMFDDIVFDHALEAHRYAAQARTVCSICNTLCSEAHAPPSSSSSQLPLLSRHGTPASAEIEHSATGMNSPNKTDSTIYLDCTVCSTKVASSRYAAHLTNCMGLSTARRSGARAQPKSLGSSEIGGRSASPTSDTNMSEDNRPLKSKSRSKGKKADEAEFNLKRKRGSPSISPNKKQKQTPKASPISRVRSEGDNLHGNTVSKSHSKVPSKLRASSTASFMERSASPSSRASSPGSMATPVSSFSQSPTFASRGANMKKGPPKGTGPPKRAKHITPPIVQPTAIAIDYMQDDAGDETGSSTDTSDSS